MSRRLPNMCRHGRVSDWGDFGMPDAEPELCYHCRRGADRDELRDLAYRWMVHHARQSESLKAAIGPLGFFRFLDIVDGLIDAIQYAYETAAPLSSVEPERAP